MSLLGFRFGEMDSETWITADGRHIRVYDMELQHLIRTVWLLRRREMALRLVTLYRMSKYIMHAPDGAAMACEMETNAIVKMKPDEFLTTIVPPFKTMLLTLAARMS